MKNTRTDHTSFTSSLTKGEQREEIDFSKNIISELLV